jgi:hypothetical protein
MTRLCLLPGVLLVLPLVVASCARQPAVDSPPDPALRDVRITYVHAAPEQIVERGFAMHLASRSGHDHTLAFSQLRSGRRTCVVTLPYPDSVGPALYWQLRRHEERHCHGEQHRGRQFQDEPPFE